MHEWQIKMAEVCDPVVFYEASRVKVERLNPTGTLFVVCYGNNTPTELLARELAMFC